MKHKGVNVLCVDERIPRTDVKSRYFTNGKIYKVVRQYREYVYVSTDISGSFAYVTLGKRFTIIHIHPNIKIL